MLDYGKDWCWSWISSTLATSCEEFTHWKRPLCWEGSGAAGEGGNRGWDGWVASPTPWTGVWVNSGSWWWTGRPGVLDSWGCKELDMTEWLNWTELKLDSKCYRNTEPAKMTFKLKDLRKWQGGEELTLAQNWKLIGCSLNKLSIDPQSDMCYQTFFMFYCYKEKQSLTPCCMCFFYFDFSFPIVFVH